jgi:hypothetical protein
VKRIVALVAGGLGIGALLGRRLRRQPVPAEPDSAHAEELRAKLAESRAAQNGEVVVAPEPESDLAARRREVHERAKRSLDELG